MSLTWRKTNQSRGARGPIAATGFTPFIHMNQPSAPGTGSKDHPIKAP